MKSDVRAPMRTLILALALLAVNARAMESHCSQQEQTIFSCVVAGSSKVISLCASKPLSKEQGALAYRFGQIGKIELEFPSSSQGSLQQFRYAHYSRFQVDRTEVSFSNGNAFYSVFDYYDGEAKPKQSNGVRVSSQNGKGRRIELLCREPVESELPRLKEVVPCDTDNALASCG